MDLAFNIRNCKAAKNWSLFSKIGTCGFLCWLYRRCITLCKLLCASVLSRFSFTISSFSFLLVKSSSTFFIDERKCKVPYPSPTFVALTQLSWRAITIWLILRWKMSYINQLNNVHSLFINHNGLIIYYWIYLNHTMIYPTPTRHPTSIAPPLTLSKLIQVFASHLNILR